jgi:hypothetical protein
MPARPRRGDPRHRLDGKPDHRPRRRAVRPGTEPAGRKSSFRDVERTSPSRFASLALSSRAELSR